MQKVFWLSFPANCRSGDWALSQTNLDFLPSLTFNKSVDFIVLRGSILVLTSGTVVKLK